MDSLFVIHSTVGACDPIDKEGVLIQYEVNDSYKSHRYSMRRVAVREM